MGDEGIEGGGCVGGCAGKWWGGWLWRCGVCVAGGRVGWDGLGWARLECACNEWGGGWRRVWWDRGGVEERVAKRVWMGCDERMMGVWMGEVRETTNTGWMGTGGGG